MLTLVIFPSADGGRVHSATSYTTFLKDCAHDYSFGITACHENAVGGKQGMHLAKKNLLGMLTTVAVK